MGITVNPKLANLVVDELPGIIGLVRNMFNQRHPDEPMPTDDDIKAAFEAAYRSSAGVDDQWLSSHPPTPPVEGDTGGGGTGQG